VDRRFLRRKFSRNSRKLRKILDAINAECTTHPTVRPLALSKLNLGFRAFASASGDLTVERGVNEAARGKFHGEKTQSIAGSKGQSEISVQLSEGAGGSRRIRQETMLTSHEKANSFGLIRVLDLCPLVLILDVIALFSERGPRGKLPSRFPIDGHSSDYLSSLLALQLSGRAASGGSCTTRRS